VIFHASTGFLTYERRITDVPVVVAGRRLFAVVEVSSRGIGADRLGT
jgi:hypothetical protein